MNGLPDGILFEEGDYDAEWFLRELFRPLPADTPPLTAEKVRDFILNDSRDADEHESGAFMFPKELWPAVDEAIAEKRRRESA